VSLGYCGPGRGGGGGRVATHWPQSAFGSSLTCLALCEIVDKKDDFTTYPGKGGAMSGAGSFPDGIYVVPREDLVRDKERKSAVVFCIKHRKKQGTPVVTLKRLPRKSP
jgi:hypothetical protein